MAFRFALEALLHVRRSLEQQEENRLRLVNQGVRDVRSSLDELELQRISRHTTQQEGLGHGLSGAELHFAMDCDGALARRRRELQKELAERERLRDQQAAKFQQARMRREILESVRANQLRGYREQEAHRTQRALDDLFLMRREFLRRG